MANQAIGILLFNSLFSGTKYYSNKDDTREQRILKCHFFNSHVQSLMQENCTLFWIAQWIYSSSDVSNKERVAVSKKRNFMMMSMFQMVNNEGV